MKRFITLCTILALAQANQDHRIVGGQNASPGQFPFIVSLRRIAEGKHICGGTIISNRAIITAAHCKVEVGDTAVVVGMNKLDDKNAKSYTVESFIIHIEYDPSTLSNDVAVILVTEDIAFNRLVQAQPLASRSITDDERLTTAGWGLTSYPSSTGPNDLQWIRTHSISQTKCFSMTGSHYLEGKICTFEVNGVGICSGDSGGPLINDQNEVVGITSSVYKCARGLPDSFTDVFYFKDWIVEQANLQ